MAYNALILLPSDTEATIEEARRVLEDFYNDEDVDFNVRDNSLTLTFDDWNCFIHLNSEPYVIEESKEMADKLAGGRADKDEIAASGVRLEISTDEDEQMDYFNDYVLIVEQLGEFRGAKIYEGAAGEFLD